MEIQSGIAVDPASWTTLTPRKGNWQQCTVGNQHATSALRVRLAGDTNEVTILPQAERDFTGGPSTEHVRAASLGLRTADALTRFPKDVAALEVRPVSGTGPVSVVFS
jgi:hypothetical protein